MIIAITFIFLFIITRFFYVQVIWGIDLQKKAIDQWTRNIPVLAKRGDIVDRNGVILSTTKESYTIFVRKRAVTDLDKVVEVLGDIFSLEKDKLKEKIKTTSVSEIKVAKHVDKEKVVQLEKYNFSSLFFS